MKQIISTLIICLILLPSLIVISESTQKHYTDDPLRFICTDGDGFNEAKYQRMVQMNEKQKSRPQSYFEIESTINHVNPIDPVSSDSRLMDSDWPMKCHDNKHSGRSQYTTANNNGAELWKFETDNWIQGGPVIDDEGIIYFGTDDLNAIYPNGTLKWSYDTIGSIWSTPAISNTGTIYVGSFSNYFYAINPDGSLKWEFNAHDSITSSPAIGGDGTIYFGTMGYPEDGGCKIYALNSDGSKKWDFQTEDVIISSPAIDDDGTIYIGSFDSNFYALNPNGTLKWKYNTNGPIKGPPSIGSDGTLYIGSYDGYLYSIDSEGLLNWNCKIGYGSETNPSIGPDGTIYVGGDKLYAIRSNGNIKWSLGLGNNRIIFQSSPAVSADGIIYVGTNIGDTSGGEIIAVNPDGTERWRHMIADRWVDSSPCIGENGIVYIGSSSDMDNSYLYAYGPGDVNNPPNRPSISGPNNGKSGESYSYVISATDPDGDDLSYFIDWGDGSNSGWMGPNPSGDEITVTHTWSFSGTYTIKVKAKDTDGSESNWATLEVTMPKNKAYYFSISKWLQAHFPLLENLFF